jgi:hypothetical protein
MSQSIIQLHPSYSQSFHRGPSTGRCTQLAVAAAPALQYTVKNTMMARSHWSLGQCRALPCIALSHNFMCTFCYMQAKPALSRNTESHQSHTTTRLYKLSVRITLNRREVSQWTSTAQYVAVQTTTAGGVAHEPAAPGRVGKDVAGAAPPLEALRWLRELAG